MPADRAAAEEQITPLEADFKTALLAALSAPHRPMRLHVQNSGTAVIVGRTGKKRGFVGAPKGTGDLVGLAGPDGLHVEVELKVREKQTPAQKARQAMIERLGGLYVLVEYVRALTLAQNVARGVRLVDEALARLRLAREHTEASGT